MARKRAQAQFPWHTSRWEKYLDGSIWKLGPKDMEGMKNVTTTRAAIFNRAKARGLKVRTTTENGHLIVQAYKETDGSSTQT
jgi:hypothetical protein